MFVAGLFTIVVITTAAAQSCPANQIASDAQIIIYDQTMLSSADIRRFANSSDPNLTFFCEILGYSEDEIQQDVQNAFQFFSERFGLEFSLVQPQ